MQQHTQFAGTDRFEIERILGEGGMGVVYLVRDREQKRRVALKTLARVDPASRYRFKKEFRALAGVSHPNLVVLHELIVAGELWFFTMEYVDGVDFLAYVCDSEALEQRHAGPTAPIVELGADARSSEVVARRTLHAPLLSEQRLRETLRQLARGIAALHAAGKLHRDIKPSNVMVTREGRVVLLDFGMIDDRNERADLTLDDQMFGTPAYMSPEQAAGDPTAEASDWYSFGVVLYEALTGSLPIDGSVLDILVRKQKEEPVAPSKRVSGVPVELDALCMDLLARVPSRRPSGAEVLARLADASEDGAGSEPVALPGAFSSFVGRDAELATLRRAFEVTRTGLPSLVLLGGRSGIGKSALVRRFCDELRSAERALVLSGRCYERESLPFKAIDSVIDALCRYLVRMPDHEVVRVLPRNVRALARLFPVLRQVHAIENARVQLQEVPDPQELRRRGFAALKELLARLSDQRPVVISIDDAHWGDDDSALLLEHLLRAPAAPAMLVICCHRQDPRSGPVLDELRRVQGSMACCDMVLGPLPEADGARLAQDELDALGDPATAGADARRIAAEAEGSPFFIGELVLAWKRELRSSSRPPKTQLSLDHVLRDRIALLQPVARRLLEVVAVAGRPVEQGVALTAADSGGRESSPAGSAGRGVSDIDVLRSAQLIGTHGTRERDTLECYHDRIRRAVLAQIEAPELRAIHLRIAEALEQSTRFEADAVANHFFLAGEPQRATSHALRAAREAADALAFDRAAALYERVLALGVVDEAHRSGLLASLGEALANAGRSAAAAVAYIEAARRSEPQARFEHERMAAEHYLRSGHVEEGVATLRRVLGGVKLGMPKSPRRALISLLLRRMRLGLRGLDYSERVEREVDKALLARIDTCWSASVGLGLIDFVRGGDFQTKHCLFALEAGEPYRLARALALEAGYLAAEGDKTETRVRDVLALAEHILARHDHPHALALTRLAHGMAAWHLGHWRKSLPLFDDAERIFRERCKGAVWEIATTQIFEAVALYYLGELRLLSQRSPLHLREAIERGDYYAASDLQTGVHVVPLLAADDEAGARALLAEEKRRWSQEGFHLQHWNQLLGDTLVDLYAGRGAEAYTRVQQRWPALKRSLVLNVQVIHVEALVLRASAALAAARDVPALRKAAFAQATVDAGRIARLRRPWADPLANMLLGVCAKQQGRELDAVSLLRAADGGFAAVEMAMHASATRRHLGEVVGGDEGAALIAGAEAMLAGQGVQRPASLVEMLAPGLVRR